MREVGQGVSRQFTREQWGRVADAGGNVKLHTGAGQPELSVGRSLGGRFLSACEGKPLTKGHKEAHAKLRDFLGPTADKLMADAGIRPGQKISAAKLKDVLTRYDASKLASTFGDPTLDMNSTKIKGLKEEIRANPGRQAPLRELAKIEGQGDTVSGRSTAINKRWDDLHAGRFGGSTNRSVRLAIQIKTMANGIAVDKLNNGRAQNVIARQIFQAHTGKAGKGSGELDAAFTSKELGLARELASNTVLMDLAAGRMQPEDAVLAVRVMAQRTGSTPTSVLELMTAQFDAEIGVLTAESVALHQHKSDNPDAPSFKFDEIPLAGEMTSKLFGTIVDANVSHQDAAVTYAKPTKDQFEKLKVEVGAWGHETGLESTADIVKPPKPRTAPTRPASSNPRPSGTAHDEGPVVSKLKHAPGTVPLPGTEEARNLTDRQYQLLRDVRREAQGAPKAEAERHLAQARRDNLDAFGGRGKDFDTLVRQAEAIDTKAALIQGLELPLAERLQPGETTTPRAQVIDYLKNRFGVDEGDAALMVERVNSWFEKAPITLTIDSTANFGGGPQPKWGSAYKPTAEINTKEIDGAGMDALVGGQGADPLNLPSRTDDAARGANYLRWRTEKDAIETDHRGLTRTEQARFAAVNINFQHTQGFEGNSTAYGQTHLLLKPDVRDRAAFNFNKTRELRADVTMLMYDMLHNRNGGGIDKKPMIDAMAHNAMGLPGMIKTNELLLEIEIFGDLDYAKDVERVMLPKTTANPALTGLNVPADVANNVRTYFTREGVPVGAWDVDGVEAMKTASIEPASLKGADYQKNLKASLEAIKAQKVASAQNAPTNVP